MTENAAAGSSPPQDTGSTVLLINARSRLGARTTQFVVQALRRRDLELESVVRVHRPSRLREAADQILSRKINRLIVGGGDGTLSTIAARLAHSQVLLGVIPLGTANDFARTLRIPTDLPRAALIASGMNVAPIDLASANGVCFLNVASIGLSVATTLKLSHGMKRWFGSSSYLLAGALAFARNRAFVTRISSPGGSIERRVHQIIVANGGFYGGGVLVSGSSTLDDGTLVVYTLGARGRLEMLRTMLLLRLKVPLHRPGDVFIRSPEVYVATEPSGRPVNLDGEIRTRTPVRFSVVPGALRVLVPE
ncbi:MAG: lipid kinase [Isosphaeraceae bacterium]